MGCADATAGPRPCSVGIPELAEGNGGRKVTTMFIERKIACASALLLSAVLAGCSGSDQPGGQEPGAEWTESTATRAAPLSYEEYREKARITLDGRQLFL